MGVKVLVSFYVDRTINCTAFNILKQMVEIGSFIVLTNVCLLYRSDLLLILPF